MADKTATMRLDEAAVLRRVIRMLEASVDELWERLVREAHEGAEE